jgi:hypothetical protein
MPHKKRNNYFPHRNPYLVLHRNLVGQAHILQRYLQAKITTFVEEAAI